jgi:predicted secreted protein
MGPTSGVVLYAVLWFVTFLTIIPIRLKTQGDVGEIVRGTQAGAPHEHHLKGKAIITTIVAAILWAIIATIILTGTITVRDLDWFGRMGPAAAGQ